VKQVFFRQGAIVVEEVPAPALEAGSVLVRTAYSCVSPGTELAGLRASGKPLLARVLAEPQRLRQAVDMVRARGVQRTLQAVRERVEALRTTGYSAAGAVIAVGSGITDLVPGDRVACAGALNAFHAEVIRVPRNLCVRVPDGLPLDEAATVTLGAIALQGIRRALPTLGETFVVIGLGALGQLTVQMLKANGCRAAVIDIDADRVRRALELGADFGLAGEDADVIDSLLRATDGHGADGVLITASGQSDAIVSLAFRLCRKKGRVVLVGDVGLNIDRHDIYEKELDFLVSTSYGPGRYDARYEEEGVDYPIGYVRWTENRNMAEYLALLSSRRVQVAALVGERRPIGEAAAAYASLSGAANRALMALLEYPQEARAPQRTVPNPAARRVPAGRLRLALVGAGSFMKGAHLPALDSLRDRYAIRAVVSRTGHNAQETARATGAAYGTTDLEAVLEDDQVDAVLVATRHHLHADLALRALRAGKHVLVEKPLALTRAQLDEIHAFYAGRSEDGAPLLLTGFNRRFSRYATTVKEKLARASNAPMLVYRMNAGNLPAGHWLHGTEGGGRNLGEACHIYDLFTFLADARALRIAAMAVPPRTGFYRADDNFSAVISYESGMVASLAYTAMGDPRAGKEQLEIFCDGEIVTLDDYRTLNSSKQGKLLETPQAEKGLLEELKAFHASVRGESVWPIPLWQQIHAMEIAFEVERQLGGN
jgi:predicted dehydrogenase